ncbi:NAD-dependent epimerase/dehydratase family protein [Aquimarina algiphila]|uniref:NAD-dependent epimerase/dehydratase family protein n=1 Tax=Aquimarina algiphila TaxID=2047982 RepID=UPI00232EA188|nr:NAD-dependent epimerase/dehydratase family protein [Aquimarina algiphila]
MNKRDFLKTVGAASILTFLSPSDVFGIHNDNSKKVLILGGRGFLGPSIVKEFLTSGYEVTLLNRGKINTHLFNNLPIIICDREKENKAGLKAIDKKYKDTYWDIVVDTWQKSPKAISDFLDEFKDRIGHYHYISSISVYGNWNKKFITENDPLKSLPKRPESIAEGMKHRYALRKTFAEEAIREKIDNYTIYRSHGMRDFRSVDPSNIIDEPFWPIRFYRGGEILLPHVKNHHIQAVDVKSLVSFIVLCSHQNTFGEFNIACEPTPFKDYVSSLIHATAMPEKLYWIDGEFLIKNGLIPYKVVPFWKPKPEGSYYFNVQKAIEAGFVHRPFVDMIKDQIEGYKYRYPKNDIIFGKQSDGQVKYYSLEHEKEIIKKWVSKQR